MNLPKKADIQIYFENLSVLPGYAEDDTRVSLDRLDADGHIHGGLRILIGSRLIPYLGYWNADDVCFGEWLTELDTLLKTFEGKETASYTYDECEQGQPAFLFEKQGEYVFLSIIDSVCSGARGDADWQKVVFGYDDLRKQYQRMRDEFAAQIGHASPEGTGRETLAGNPSAGRNARPIAVTA